jgi:hypothetical protein
MGMMLYEGRVATAAFGLVVGLQAAVMCCAAGEAAAAVLRAAERHVLDEGEFEEEEEGGGGGGDHAAPGSDDDDDDVEAGAVERRSWRERALQQVRRARGGRRADSDAHTLRLTRATACALLLALLVHALLAYRSGTSTLGVPVQCERRDQPRALAHHPAVSAGLRRPRGARVPQRPRQLGRAARVVPSSAPSPQTWRAVR